MMNKDKCKGCYRFRLEKYSIPTCEHNMMPISEIKKCPKRKIKSWHSPLKKTNDESDIGLDLFFLS